MNSIKKNLSRLLILVAIGFVIVIFIDYLIDLKNTPMPDRLHPVVAEKRDTLISQAKEKGISILITDDFRTVEKQNRLYEQGRSEEGNIVTYAKGGSSYHNYGLAIDFAIQLENGHVIWDLQYDGNENGHSDWMEVVDLAKNLGFEWGGDWESFKDYPHLQIDFGLSIRELQWGKRP
ncbi:M15 family metallopeptidase [Salinibacillus xinjiangensis]